MESAKSLTVGPICNFNYKNAIENRVMGTENSQNVFLVFITHYSKIRELNDENKNWKQSYENPNNLFSHGSHNFWVMSYENRVMSYRNSKSKQPINISPSVVDGVPTSCASTLVEIWVRESPPRCVLDVGLEC